MSILIDGILVLLLLVFAFMGFSYGIVKVGTVIIGMWIGLQVAALFYPIFGNLTATPGNNNSLVTNQIVWFFILWIAWSIIFTLVGFSFTNSIILPKRIGNLDQLGGLVLGMFAGVFGMIIISFVLKNVIVLLWAGAGGPDNWLKAMKDGFDNSTVFNIFKAVKVVYLNILSPWLPSNKIPVFLDTVDVINKSQ